MECAKMNENKLQDLSFEYLKDNDNLRCEDFELEKILKSVPLDYKKVFGLICTLKRKAYIKGYKDGIKWSV